MKIKILMLFLFTVLTTNAQSLIQTVNSGNIVVSKTSVSIGEIVIVPVNQVQSNSGIIGILSQVNGQNLEVSQFAVAGNIIVYPNPSFSKIYFDTKENLWSETILVFDNSGKMILQSKLSDDNSLDLALISEGIYMIQFLNSSYKSFKIIKK